ncbi:hypothetical protein EDB83DRAFT_2312239 [Lactarius deliciosus]|nr:hypothetical protein EDB83DRAFT_2312239 [Lactarius deliciosus]
MSQLSKKDQKVVKRWWKCCATFIHQKGYILDKYSPSLIPSHLPETCRSFQEIVNAGAIISVTAKRNGDKHSVKLTLVKGARDEEDAQGDATYFDVPANHRENGWNQSRAMGQLLVVLVKFPQLWEDTNGTSMPVLEPRGNEERQGLFAVWNAQ